MSNKMSRAVIGHYHIGMTQGLSLPSSGGIMIFDERKCEL